jgi:hypothetical protein
VNIKAQCFRKDCPGARQKKVYAVTWLILRGLATHRDGPTYCPVCGLRMRVIQKISQGVKGATFGKKIGRSRTYKRVGVKLGLRKSGGRKKTVARKYNSGKR